MNRPRPILLVDDDADMCRELARGLTKSGFAVETAQSADEAYEKLERVELAAVVTDLNMRGTSGIELCQRIVQNHPAVLEAAAYPVRADLPEDEVMVSVVLRAGASLTPEALLAHCNANMAYFMVPRFVEFVPALPRTMTEKVEKYRLRESAQARLASVWDREKAGVRLTR